MPKVLDEEVARLHLTALGAELEVLSEEKAKYIHVEVQGPYKKDTYRYWLFNYKIECYCYYFINNQFNFWKFLNSIKDVVSLISISILPKNLLP